MAEAFYNPSRRTEHQAVIRYFRSFGDQGMGPDDAIAPHAGPVHHGGAHADERMIANRAAVEYGTVAHHAVASQLQGHAMIHMQDGIVLDIAVASDADPVFISADDGTVPYRGMLAQAYITDDGGIVCYKYLLPFFYAGQQFEVVVVFGRRILHRAKLKKSFKKSGCGNFRFFAFPLCQSRYFCAMKEKTILGLELPTDPRWSNLAALRLEDILSDHAYCEQKAASTCISLIQQYPDREELVEAVAPIVSEEWGHFRMVLNELKKRGLKLGRQRKDVYVNQLLAAERKGGGREERLLERLLIAALIEARSCERFRLLSEGLEEEALQQFYHRFMVSEAGHYRLFLDLAKRYFPEEKVKKRWKEWLAIEAEIIKNLELRGDRMH